MGNQKYTIEDIHKIVTQKGGKCLDSNFPSAPNGERLTVECACGYQWNPNPYKIISGQWCPRCAGNLKDSLESMRKIAADRGGKCLSKEYVSSDVKLMWECSVGHTWEATPGNIKSGKWCKKCYLDNKVCPFKLTIDDAREYAFKLGGKCLSETYVDANSKLKWQCKEGHQWEANFSSIRHQKCWCPKCSLYLLSKRKLEKKLQRLIRVAEKKGGQCLTTEVEPLKRDPRYKFKCSQGHVWEATAGNVLYGKGWCRECSVEQVRLGLEVAKKYAEMNEGKCLSKEYINIEEKMTWQCKEDHIFIMSFKSVKHGKSWCPECRAGLNAQDMNNFAISKGGRCLSDNFNKTAKVLWECSNGHQWKSTFKHAREHWCGECSNILKKVA